MKKLAEKLNKIFDFSLRPISLWGFLGLFSGVVVIRLILDNIIAKTGNTEIFSIMNIHNWLFFLNTLLLVWLTLAFILGKKPSFLARFMALGSLMFVLPPIFDLLKIGGSVYWSAYLMGNIYDLAKYFFSIFGGLPSGITYFGTKIAFILGILMVFLWVWHLTKRTSKALISAIGMYVALFFMASFPSWLVFITKLFTGIKSAFLTEGFEIAQRIGTPLSVFGLNKPNMAEALAYNLNLIYFSFLLGLLAVMFFLEDRKKLTSIIRNARIPQIAYHTGVFVCGWLLGLWYYTDRLTLNLSSFWAFSALIWSIWSAWTASVIFNDLVDRNIDNLTNPNRPIPLSIFSNKEYFSLGWVFFLLSILGGWVVNEKMAFILLGYQIIAWWYSGETLRLKKIPVLATLLASLASALIFLMGFLLVSGEDNLKFLPFKVLWLIVLAFTFSLPIKDFKDIPGDKKDGVMTIPVVFGEDWGKIIVAGGVFLSFILSVFLTNELKLFYPAVFLGVLSFWTIFKSSPAGLIRYRFLPFWIFALVFVYGIIFVLIVFYR